MRKRALRCSGLGLALLLQCLTLPSRALACVVGTGTGTCTEAALNTCLPGGGSFDGTVTFNCGGAATITVSSTKTISADTTLDGGSLITISGGHFVGVFSVNAGVTFTIQNLTISNGNSAGNGGGIYNWGSGTLTVTNTIVANSTSGGNCAGSVTDGGHNIDNGTTCGFTGTGCTTTGNSFCNTNPHLDPAGLANNGGPTQTIALCTGTGAPSAGCTVTSPGINAGDESVCSTTTGTAPVDNLDQRGFIRPGTDAANCSIGAFEANSASPCIGDCNGKRSVTVDELLTMVNIALGNAPVTTCEAGDANHDGHITVDEILTAVNNALNGC
ncbi:MAG TPA: choice-of-anchor Q domain-containing protein [Candidatus Binatia bacterium]